MTKPPDLVTEARELLKLDLPVSTHSIEHALWADAIERQHESPFWGNSKKTAEAYARAPELLRQLADEVERLRKHIADLDHDFDAAMKEADDAETIMMRKMYGR